MNETWASMQFALRAVADLTGTIFVPAIVAALAGRAVDARYGIGHTMFGILLVLTFIATAVVLVKKIRHYAKEYQQLITR